MILNKENVIVAVLGNNPDPGKGRNYNIPQDQWVEGAFSGTHGSNWDAEGICMSKTGTSRVAS